MRKNERILFRGGDGWKLFDRLLALEDGAADRAFAEREAYAWIGDLVQYCTDLGFSGNLWHAALTNLLVDCENPYSLSAEVGGKIDESARVLALADMALFHDCYRLDLKSLGDRLGVPAFSVITDYADTGARSKVYSNSTRDRIMALSRRLAAAGSPAELLDLLTGFYAVYGVGSLGLHKAFRIEEEDGEARIVPIRNIPHVRLADLVGYESAKKKLVDNTEAFVAKRPANNCLLYGEAGTGKSSSIKAITNEYYEKGLRIIEVYRHQFQCLNDVIAKVKNRNYRFILYMDDLSFEEFETEYKYLKAVIEGGLERKPDNVLIYATSNRRHLIRESFRDRDGVDIADKHGGDTVQEKLSLSGRFGVSIYYGAPSFDEYHEIVRALARRQGIRMDDMALKSEATKWEMRHGGLSGRTAQQFVDYVRGSVEIEQDQAEH